MNKEAEFLNIINGLISDNSYLGDDCAYLKEFGLIASTDAFVEDVHFKTSYFTPYEIGKKAVLVNASDILAGGGRPLYILISLSGALTKEFIEEFYKGADEVCNQYKIKIIGGDLTGGGKIAVSITILGKALGNKRPSLKNAKEGDFVYIKGFHGNSAMGLKYISKENFNPNNIFIKAHKEPVLYPETSYFIAKNIKDDYVMTDTSDGVYEALRKIAAASKTGFEIDYNLIPKQIEDKKLVLFGGEDYGLIFCLNPKYDNIVKETGIIKIGTVIKENKIIIKGAENLCGGVFNHF